MNNGSCIARSQCWFSWEDDEALLNFSDDFLDEIGWQEGDTLEFEILEDDTVVLRKAEQEDCIATEELKTE